MTHRDDDRVQRALVRLNSTFGMPWKKLEQELGLPQATLWDIADGKPVPRKWRKQLGLTVFRDLYAMPVSELRWAIRNRR